MNYLKVVQVLVRTPLCSNFNACPQEMDRADRQPTLVSEERVAHIKKKIETIKIHIQRLNEIKGKLSQLPDGQLCLTDPDARCMATRGRQTPTVAYNVQTAVDAKHHLIVAHEVTNVGNDRTALTPMAEKAREAMGTKELTVIADRGYFSGEQILRCEQRGMTPFVPKSITSGYRAKGLFDKRDFEYIEKDNEFRCPAGERAVHRFTTVEHGQTIHKYWASACPRCPLKPRCTTGEYRRVHRWEHEAVIDRMQRRLDQHPEVSKLRRQTAEHPFRTLKAWMGATHFLPRTFPRVSTEMSLHVLAYSMKRVIQMIGAQPFMAAMKS